MIFCGVLGCDRPAGEPVVPAWAGRPEGRPVLNVTGVLLPLRDRLARERFPLITLALITVNVLVFFYELSLGPRGEHLLFQAAGAIPAELRHRVDLGVPNRVPWPLTVFTSQFLHGDLWHLVGNMWFLWIFGDNVEDAMGRGRFLLFYLLVGALAAACQLAVLSDSTVPMIGASGAIAGVLGAYLALYPRQRISCLLFIVIFFTIVEVPAYLVLWVWFMAQMLSATHHTPGVAWFAHIGGFIGGLALARLVTPARRRALWEGLTPRGPEDREGGLEWPGPKRPRRSA